jgi:hypothetical protein
MRQNEVTSFQSTEERMRCVDIGTALQEDFTSGFLTGFGGQTQRSRLIGIAAVDWEPIV